MTLLRGYFDLFSKYAGTEDEANLHPFWRIANAKNGSPCAEEDGLRLHSAYNPEREAEGAVRALLAPQPAQNGSAGTEEPSAIVFLGMGLGYAPLAAAAELPQKTLLIVEPDAEHFLAALLFLDFTALFQHQKLVLAISCTPEQAITLINQNGVEQSRFLCVKSQAHHNEAYFSAVQSLVERNRAKEQINCATLKKFEKRWTQNCKKNAPLVRTLQPVNAYKDTLKGLPFLLLAAGPSLQDVLSDLPALHERMVTVCVDTALKAALRAGVQPDFIILTDPQYWAYRHISGLCAPHSILITEIAVYPAVFRFACKKILLCNSQVPMAKEFCTKELGDLGAGGSVASAAWNFCRFAGASAVYAAGLDLAFPKGNTHARGSTFEESAHTTSFRTRPAETLGATMSYSANPCYGTDYNGNPVLTDQRMKMFAWWFESRLAECPDLSTYTFAPQGLAIPGITPRSMSDALLLPEFSRANTILR